LNRIGTGKSESITITNEKGRLSQEDIERMVREAEEFASEDEAQRKRIEALNALSSFVFGLRAQLNDSEGLGSKLSSEDKSTLEGIVKDTGDWIDENGTNATVEDLEEKLQGECSVYFLMLMTGVDLSSLILLAVQGVVSPITAKLYSQGSDEPLNSHDEL
jgi:endoplasmic reticulum chaperone BiP